MEDAQFAGKQPLLTTFLPFRLANEEVNLRVEIYYRADNIKEMRIVYGANSIFSVVEIGERSAHVIEFCETCGQRKNV